MNWLLSKNVFSTYVGICNIALPIKNRDEKGEKRTEGRIDVQL